LNRSLLPFGIFGQIASAEDNLEVNTYKKKGEKSRLVYVILLGTVEESLDNQKI